MTTAHRPTWKPQVGSSDQNNSCFIPSRSYSSRDLPGYLNLKGRQPGQGSINDLQSKDFKQDLIDREKKYLQLKQRQSQNQNLNEEEANAKSIEPEISKKIKNNSEPVQNQLDTSKKEDEKQQTNLFPQDADDEEFLKSPSSSSDNEQSQKQQQKSSKKKDDSDDKDSDSNEDDSDSEDENEQLLREFQKIKEQKEQEAKEKLSKKVDEYDQNEQFEVLKGNPLLVESGSYSLKRRWYEDTVFKNQARLEQKDKKTFINDNVRNPFHRKFLSKYIYT